MKMLNKVAMALMASASLIISSQVSATTATGSLATSATITNTCTIGNGTLAFGAFVPTDNQDTPFTGSFTLTCTAGTAVQLTLDAGTGTGATTATRVMQAAGGYTLPYKIYQDDAHTTNWGNVAGTDSLDLSSAPSGISGQSAVTDGTAQTVNVYGVIPADPSAEGTQSGLNYTDTITITATY